MNRVRAFAYLLLILVGLALGPAARAQLGEAGRNAITAELRPESTHVESGESVTLALTMRPEPGWHGYWKNPGDAGSEMRTQWALPEGVTAGPFRYPVPERLTIAGLMNYVYERDYTLLVDLQIPQGLVSGTSLPIRAQLAYLACTNEICVPESATVATELTVGDPASGQRLALDDYREALPRPLAAEARFELRGDMLRLAIPIPATLEVGEPYFFPLTQDAIRYAAPQSVSRAGEWLIVETEAGRAAGSLDAIEGVFRIGDELGLSLVARPGNVPDSGVALTGAAGAPAILAALLGALLGGLLLNIMPCVFPILSLKALSLAKAGGDERAARRDALAYAAGVILVCLALGALLLGLRAGGAAVGWAFQLQDPRVILLLLLLVTAIALNLSGLFELPALGGGGRLAASGGTVGSFWTGALAAFVATPCTGPFMGVALGAALVLPTAAALAVFAGLGLGLALPFLLLGFIPALRRRLPKPGAWMARLRRILSVPMWLTALGLAWILGRQAGTDALALGVGAALVVGLALGWFGARQGRARGWLPLSLAAVATVAAILLVPTAPPSAAVRDETLLENEPFSAARLAALRAEGRPVFLYFTADWCLTCKINERGVLASEEVAASFDACNVAVLVGDWTRGDAEIGRFLERHGRSGVPFYLYYPPGEPPVVLPQILTVRRLTELTA